jgi:hypothetical protein
MKALHVHITPTHNWCVRPDGGHTPMVSHSERAVIMKFVERYHLKTGCDIFVHDEAGAVQEYWHVDQVTAAHWRQHG